MDTENSTEAPVCDSCRRVPVSHLSLDVPEPVKGWEAYFEEKGIMVMDDAAGRPSVARHVLADLIAEQRERQVRLAERPQLEPEPLPVGVPAVSDDATAFESLMAGDRSYVSPQEEFGRPRPDFLAEELEAGQRRQLAERAAIKERKEKERKEKERKEQAK